MRARIEEFAQPLGRERDRIGTRDSDSVKTSRACECTKRRFERVRI
jgi:hypothetical protein